MKKLVILLFSVLLVSCANTEGYKISIDMQDLAGSKIILKQNVARDMISIDSVTLDENGQGTITGISEAPEIMYLTQDGSRNSLAIFLDNYAYSVSGTFEDVSIEADGGPQVDYNSYKDGSLKFEEKLGEIYQLYNEAAAAKVSEDSLNAIREIYYENSKNKELFDSTFMTENPSSAVSLYLLRGTYFQLSMEELEEALAPFDESLHASPYYKHMNEQLQNMKNVRIGASYIDFELPDTSGVPVKLSDIAGKGILLIDFWASWCGPCRRANPDVLEIYNEYHEKGFDIIGVSLDRTREDWIKGIKEDALPWHHVSDIKFWDCEPAKLYAVSSIPHTVLLDAEGKIVARNLHKDELKAKIEELLAE